MEGTSKRQRKFIAVNKKHGKNNPWTMNEPLINEEDSFSSILISRTLRKKFNRQFCKRNIVPPHYMDKDEMHSLGIDFQELLIQQGLQQFMSLKNDYFPELVKLFYCNLKVSNGVLISSIGRTHIEITADMWALVDGLSMDGLVVDIFRLKQFPGISMEMEWPVIAASTVSRGFDPLDTIEAILLDPTHKLTSQTFTAHKMTVKSRMIQFLIAKILNPRISNFARVADCNLFLIWVILNNININWPHFIMDPMSKVAHDEKSALPYACLVSKFIMHFHAHFPHGETKQLSRPDRIGKNSVKRIKLVWVNEEWVYGDDVDDVDEDEEDALPPAGVSAPVQPTMDPSSIPLWFTAAMDLYKEEMKNYMDHHYESLRRSQNEKMQLKVRIQTRVMGEADIDCSPLYMMFLRLLVLSSPHFSLSTCGHSVFRFFFISFCCTSYFVGYG